MQQEIKDEKKQEKQEMNGLELAALLNLGKEAIDSIGKFFKSLKLKPRKILSYRAVIEELVNNKPKDPTITKGAALRNKLNEKLTEVTIIYMNAKNEPVFGPDDQSPYGCVIQCEQLDEELKDSFGTQDVIIFE